FLESRFRSSFADYPGQQAGRIFAVEQKTAMSGKRRFAAMLFTTKPELTMAQEVGSELSDVIPAAPSIEQVPA
ncbi:hypothetical protein ACVBEH_33450, partial [Roseateles sp. GG27B]